jgi:kinesin family protein 4/21/27
MDTMPPYVQNNRKLCTDFEYEYTRSGAHMLVFSFFFYLQIMAYGQTGSGKTFTMGSEAHADGEDMCLHPGLIPRFMSDVFANLEQRKSESDAAKIESALLEYRVSASFLEVYGEDVHDLLDKD